jgi:putative component of membrane protein insertase Oxa1/YidC/SpoIIIJ protein YidD
MTPFAFIVSIPVRAYRLIFSPWVGFNCRYQPTCSAYALRLGAYAAAIHGEAMDTILFQIRRTNPNPVFSNTLLPTAIQIASA